MRDIKAIHSDIRETRKEMRAKGIKRTSCLNGGLSGDVYTYNARMFALETELQGAKKYQSETDNRRADEAMRRLWGEWFQFYDRHFRGPGIAISMADQQAFFEIAQPIMRSLANVG